MSKKEIHNLDGTSQIVDLSAEETSSRETANTKNKEIHDAEVADRENKDNLKASAKTKLMNGEALTEDEANVMVGL